MEARRRHARVLAIGGVVVRAGRGGSPDRDRDTADRSRVRNQQAAFRLARATPVTLGEIALDSLRASILSGQFAAGERLVEVALAQELGISRGPLREAMAQLAKDGLIEHVPRRGKYVVQFTTRAVDEHYGLRKVLETYAVELFIRSKSPAKTKALERAWRRLRDAAEGGNGLRMALADLNFHATIYQLADDELVARVWRETLAGRLRLLVNFTSRTHAPIEEEVQNHRRILEAIIKGDVEAAQAEIHRHIDDAWHRIRKAVADDREERAGRSSSEAEVALERQLASAGK
jgi:DNA-binding GntR family transcriptional regulator